MDTQFVQVSSMNNDRYNYEKNLMWTNPMGSPGYIDGKFVFILAKDRLSSSTLCTAWLSLGRVQPQQQQPAQFSA